MIVRAAAAAGMLVVATLAACTKAPAAPNDPGVPGTLASSPSPPRPVPLEDMVHIEAGTFVRGHEPPDRPDERPLHTVKVDAFSIDRTLVTRAQFARFVGETSYRTTAERIGYGVASREGMDDWAWERVPGASWDAPFISRDADSRTFLRPDAPVVMVSWFDAVAFCAFRDARLPTEAEWEYAMRAGAKESRFPWGDTPMRNGRLGLNFWQGASHHENLREDGFVYVSPVRAFEPNAWGLYDPVGNVWQWVADWYAPNTYARAAAEGVADNPHGPQLGTTRVLRGGSWWCGSCTCEGYGFHYRGKADPNAAFNNNGFRCARSEQRG